MTFICTNDKNRFSNRFLFTNLKIFSKWFLIISNFFISKTLSRHFSIMLSFVSNAFFVINFEHIVFLHQIYYYVQKHDDTSELTATIKEFVRFIVLTNLKINEIFFSRSTFKSQSVKFVAYSENWIIIKFIKQTIFRNFKKKLIIINNTLTTSIISKEKITIALYV